MVFIDFRRFLSLKRSGCGKREEKRVKKRGKRRKKEQKKGQKKGRQKLAVGKKLIFFLNSPLDVCKKKWIFICQPCNLEGTFRKHKCNFEKKTVYHKDEKELQSFRDELKPTQNWIL